MTPIEIYNRLKTEFPGKYVSFTLDVTSRGSYTDPSIEMSLYWSNDGVVIVPCTSLEQGIESLKAKLGLSVPEMELVV